MSPSPDDRKAAEEAVQKQFEENRVGEWFETKQDEVRLRQEQRASGETPWYEQARERARGKQTGRDDPSGETRRIDEELAERREAYERDVWRRAVNSPRTREEHELLQAAKDAPPELRRKIENEILAQRMHNIRVRDDAERLAELEHDMKPSLRERFAAFVTREREVDHYPEPEPGPYYEPHSPAELEKARERMIKENERER